MLPNIQKIKKEHGFGSLLFQINPYWAGFFGLFHTLSGLSQGLRIKISKQFYHHQVTIFVI